jgi:hypothetical protein
MMICDDEIYILRAGFMMLMMQLDDLWKIGKSSDLSSGYSAAADHDVLDSPLSHSLVKTSHRRGRNIL